MYPALPCEICKGFVKLYDNNHAKIIKLKIALVHHNQLYTLS